MPEIFQPWQLILISLGKLTMNDDVVTSCKLKMTRRKRNGQGSLTCAADTAKVFSGL